MGVINFHKCSLVIKNYKTKLPREGVMNGICQHEENREDTDQLAFFDERIEESNPNQLSILDLLRFKLEQLI